jgi:hypothetical protein
MNIYSDDITASRTTIINDQFYEDFMLVAQNDDEFYTELRSNSSMDTQELADDIYTNYVELVAQIQELVEREISEVAGLMVTQIMTPPSTYVFREIAKAVKQK